MPFYSKSVWSFVLFVIILLALGEAVILVSEKIISDSPAVEFKRHRLVQPTVHHARTRREITSTRHTDGMHHREVTVTVPIDGEEYVLDLRLNVDLVAGGHVISYQKGGRTVQHKPNKEDLDICQYFGTVRGKKNSWVAVSTCHGLRGVLHDGEQMRYIEPTQGNIDSEHFLYEHTDLNTEFNCGYVGGVTNNTEYDAELLKEHLEKETRGKSRKSRYKRDTKEDTVLRGPFDENKLSRYVELVLVADHEVYLANGERIESVHHQLKDIANIVNSLFNPLNIFISLTGVVVWTERDEITLDEEGDTTLTNFLHYRRTRLALDIPNDNAMLLTVQKFKDGALGKALKGPICTSDFSGGVATNHSQVIGHLAASIAHMLGHNFGMEHDTEACECPDEKCIMTSSYTSNMATHWSSCSQDYLQLSFERGMDYCLRNKPPRLFDSPTCGNGFVEPGEQCDCGLHGSPACLACCDPLTCSLKTSAFCGIGECCDPQTCQLKSAGTLCRSADKECDLPEFCTGHSEFCPRDVYKMDATPCFYNQAYCVQGSCRTHTDQCRLLWGFTAYSSDTVCYTTSNVKGTRYGNCGKSHTDPREYVRCAPEDSLCGLLQCRHLNERLEFGMESVSVLGASYIKTNGKSTDISNMDREIVRYAPPRRRGHNDHLRVSAAGSLVPCRTAMIDLGINDPDPGMVPDGAKCGENKMCLNQRCVAVETVVEPFLKAEGSVCPSNCSGHGVCNSEGNCHCEPGYIPPLCTMLWPGGSYNSGPDLGRF